MHRRVIVVRLFVAILFSLLVAGCELLEQGCDPDKSYTYQPDLPPSAEVTSLRCDYVTYRLVFRLAAEDLAAFQAAVPVEEWHTQRVSRIFADPPHASEAARASRYLYGEHSDGVYLITVLIDMSDDQTYIVYYDSDNID